MTVTLADGCCCLQITQLHDVKNIREKANFVKKKKEKSMRVSIARVFPSCRVYLTLLNIFVFHILAMVVLQLLCPYMKRKILACRDLRGA